MSPRIQIKLRSGGTLEGILVSPASVSGEGEKLAICLHPWSRLGGSMNDPVLNIVTETLERLRYHVLRFNSRGVGRSTGWASLTGLAEGKDLEEVTAWAVETIPDVRSVVIIGYSHGSLIASLQPVLPGRVTTRHILLSYPLGVRGLLTLFHSGTYATALKNLVQDPNGRVLVVYGDRDEFTGERHYESWKGELEEMNNGKGTVQICKVENATHFWHDGAGRALVRTVEDWLAY